ncbi:hypothetical protein Q8W71_30065 [Methylobacterium sp. NEAU 140]|uniref:hypothetical protein n=1 Tax=Methylobacterium sp. NEAU 140 TaxID=3064945 RepID=UPI002735295B|nr:hypothetical protein [Methylobacterium sp. NEAU 140]MDP4026847.1 hypothetical protein [Methylobacterium sp. NEAU 140]
MSNVLTFTPRPRPAPPEVVVPQPEASLRARVEAAAEIAVDTAERLIAILDAWDGDADLEPDADAEPSLAAPENAHGSQVVWMRGGDGDREAQAPETVLPEVSRSPTPRVRSVPAPASAPLAWGGNGNVVSAAGVALFGLLAGEA